MADSLVTGSQSHWVLLAPPCHLILFLPRQHNIIRPYPKAAALLELPSIVLLTTLFGKGGNKGSYSGT